MKNIARAGFLILIFSFLFSCPVQAEDKLEPRLISVTGEANVKVVPNEAVLVLGVETDNQDLNAAKIENDKKAKKIIEIAKQFKIEASDIQTNHLNIEPRYRYVDQSRKKIFEGYFVSQTIAITLKDISKAEELLSSALMAGVNYVYSMTFRTSELRKYRDQARSLAVKAALEKANALAKELGQEVGKPHTIREGEISSWGGGWNNDRMSAQVQRQVESSDYESSETEGSIALGQINVTAKVNVSFELL